ncbi:MAG: hypothetical protein AAGJ28_09475 [Pseudomonadota bacterium]
MTILNKFLRDESGAVTIDWVALTAGILLLGITVVYALFNGGVDDLTGSINTQLNTASTNNVTTGTVPTPASIGGGT